MDDSFNLARHVARFIWLLMRQPNAVDQQKLELRTLVLMTKEGTVRLSTREGQLSAGGLSVPMVLSGVRDFADQLVGHEIESIELTQGMAPGELLSVGRIIAEPLGGDTADLHRRLRALETKTVVVVPREAGVETPGRPRTVEQRVAEPAPGSPERIPFILARAARGGDGLPIVPHFEEVAFAIEQATREGKVETAISVFTQLIAHETKASDGEVRRHFVLTVRRLTKPRLLYPIAHALVADSARAAEASAILQRCGTDGADAVIDQYGRARTAAERQAFYDALDKFPSTDASLIAMLADVRPHVMRVAAELVGVRTPAEGDHALADQITAADPRARRAAVRALAAYDTQFAIDAMARALEDPVIEVRLEAVAGLSRRKAARAGDIIGRAMDAEEEVEVQVGMLSALGRIGTSDAVARLAKAAEAGSGLFSSRRGSAVRVAAVRALGEARTASALNALKSLVNDKEREVREAAVRAVAR